MKLPETSDMWKERWPIRAIQRTLHPAWYHGHRAQPPFFEGWYFKIVDATGRYKFAVIPGIFKDTDRQKSHSFIQLLDGIRRTSSYVAFGQEDFHAGKKSFSIRIGDSSFAQDRIALDVHHHDLILHGTLRFNDLKPWPVTLSSPGIMGWYAWVPFMECFHGVLSMDHGIEGGLEINGEYCDFSGGRGYIEKDWGRAFPKGYIWMQSNHFAGEGISLTASVAIIPWIRKPFPGFIVGFLFDGTLYRFATYNNSRMHKLRITDTHVHWVLFKRPYTLEIEAERNTGGILQAPTLSGMDRRIVETMNATVRVRLSKGQGQKSQTLFEGTGKNCGLEAAGDIDALLALRR